MNEKCPKPIRAARKEARPLFLIADIHELLAWVGLGQLRHFAPQKTTSLFAVEPP
jgi:hypothetical protein